MELVVGSRASLSMVDRSLVGSTKAPLMNENASGQAAQPFSASSWMPRNPEGRPAGAASYGPGTVASIVPATVPSTVLRDVLVALQEHETPRQAAADAAQPTPPQPTLQPTPPQPTLPQGVRTR